MEISEYYNEAKRIGGLPELNGTEASERILAALDYDRMDDHPSNWVPKVQESLLQCFSYYSNEAFSKKVLDLYVQGAIMEEKAKSNDSVKIGFACLFLSVFVGWFLWA